MGGEDADGFLTARRCLSRRRDGDGGKEREEGRKERRKGDRARGTTGMAVREERRTATGTAMSAVLGFWEAPRAGGAENGGGSGPWGAAVAQ
ncbi:hypothetical protein E2562_008066 [Oryza meyeriana var. granulata]|uniref:DUF834 domain-containing protein n=1 Tax=Oryza meyeriana var. granulata TaxID=110450 RepID=A0A6G1DFQ3_9ORYZ|nr:hypothetical protein E2562_008066 [Oryza meyeriana var. granulata]